MASDPLSWLDDALAALERSGLRRTLAVRGSPQGAKIELDGRRYVNFGSNDYLGLADQGLARAACEAVQEHGWGSGASPLVTGRGVVHARLEKELARFEGTEAALLFSTGYAANVGAVTALAGLGDAVFSDAKNHASIIDGCRLSGACVFVYPHRDCAPLELLLKENHSFRRRLIVTDSLFSMDGDLAPLPELAELAQRFGAMLMVDEAHATGVFGRNGRGACEHLGVEDGVHVRVGTLSKSLGSLGGFVAGRRSLIDWLANRARSYVFSTAAPEALSAAGLEALRIVRDEPHRRRELLERAASLRDRLRNDGWNVGQSESQIIPVLLGAPQLTMQLSAALRERGYLAPGIRPPSVPEGESLLRISLSYAHSQEVVAKFADALKELRSFRES
jgi:8-amino-7-oxononanoate synthase